MVRDAANRTPNKTCDYCKEPYYIQPSKILKNQSGLFFCSMEHKHLYATKPNTKCAFCNLPLYRKPTTIAKNQSGSFFCSQEHQALASRANSGISLQVGPAPAINSLYAEINKAARERKYGNVRQCKYCPNVFAISRLVEDCCHNCIYIERWLRGEESGTLADGESMAGQIRRYIKTLRGEHCWVCGWNTVHPITGKIPLQIDHIDGDAANNHIDNLQLLCPSHHAMTPFYRNGGNRTKPSARIKRKKYPGRKKLETP